MAVEGTAPLRRTPIKGTPLHPSKPTMESMRLTIDEALRRYVAAFDALHVGATLSDYAVDALQRSLVAQTPPQDADLAQLFQLLHLRKEPHPKQD